MLGSGKFLTSIAPELAVGVASRSYFHRVVRQRSSMAYCGVQVVVSQASFASLNGRVESRSDGCFASRSESLDEEVPQRSNGVVLDRDREIIVNLRLCDEEVHIVILWIQSTGARRIGGWSLPTV